MNQLYKYYIDWSEFSFRTGWNNVYDFGKRIAGLAAFIVVSSALVPIWSPSQTVEQYQLNENARQLHEISNVLPGLVTDVAVIKEHLASMDRRAIETQQSVDSLKNTGTWVIFGMLAWMAKEIFGYFGTRFGVRGNGNEKGNGQQ